MNHFVTYTNHKHHLNMVKKAVLPNQPNTHTHTQCCDIFNYMNTEPVTNSKIEQRNQVEQSKPKYSKQKTTTTNSLAKPKINNIEIIMWIGKDQSKAWLNRTREYSLNK